MSKNESLKSTIHTIDNQYFLEEICYTEVLNRYKTQESSYWLGKYGSDHKVWVGQSATMNLEMAGERVRKMLERGIREF